MARYLSPAAAAAREAFESARQARIADLIAGVNLPAPDYSVGDLVYCQYRRANVVVDGVEWDKLQLKWRYSAGSIASTFFYPARKDA